MDNSELPKLHVKPSTSDPGLGDDIPCSKCGSALDTGLECTECGHDMWPEVYPRDSAIDGEPLRLYQREGE